MAIVQVCIFNPVTTLIDQVAAASSGPGVPGQPIVLNGNGLIDSSLLGQGVIATAGQTLTTGNLVNLYSQGGALYMQLAYAAYGGTAPSTATYPVTAVGFVSNQIFTGFTGEVSFSGTFIYIDGNSEFSASDIGDIVFLSTITPGGVTKTAPIGVGQLAQSVGYVVGFASPNQVTVAFSAAFLDFMQIGGILPITKGGTGATTGAQALINLIGGTPAPTDVLTWNGSAWVPSSPTGVGGASHDVQSNQSGAFYGDAGFQYIPNTSVLLTNVTPATSGANHAAPSLVFDGNWWNGSASQTDSWTLNTVYSPSFGPANNTLNLTYAGGPGGSFGGYFAVNCYEANFNCITTMENVFANYLLLGNEAGYGGATDFVTSAANAAGGLTIYTVPLNTNHPIGGMYVTFAGFTHPGNNGRFVVQTNTGTSITVYNSGGVAETPAFHTATWTVDTVNEGGSLVLLGGYLGTYTITGSVAPFSSFYMQENSIAASNQMNTVWEMDGNYTDSGFAHIVNNGATGQHGLEIGAVTDGTGANPTYLRIGQFSPAKAVQIATGLAATSSVSQPAPALEISGNYWNGSASTQDSWTLSSAYSNSGAPNPPGTNDSSVLSLVYAGGFDAVGYFNIDVYRTTIQSECVMSSASASTMNVGGNTYSGATGAFTSVANAVGPLTTYTGGATTELPPISGYITITGFVNGANNGRFIIEGSTNGGSSSVTVYNSSGVAESHAATYTLDNANGAGLFTIAGEGAGTYAITGSAAPYSTYEIGENISLNPNDMCLVMVMQANHTDSAFYHIVNNGGTGDHGLEIGAVIDGTGTNPAFMRVGYFGGREGVYIAGTSTSNPGTLYVGLQDSVLGVGGLNPSYFDVAQPDSVNRIAIKNMGTASTNSNAFVVWAEDNFAGGSEGFDAVTFEACTTNTGTVTINATVFPNIIVGATLSAHHIGTGNLAGTFNGPTGAFISATNETTATVSNATGAIIDIGNSGGGTITNATGIWVGSLGDPGGTITTATGLYIAPQVAGAATAWGVYVDGTTPSYFGGPVSSASGTSQVKRLKVNQGTAYSGADSAIALSGWGTGAAVSSATGYDQSVQFTVTAGAGPSDDPTITITFKDGTFTTVPLAIAAQNGGTGSLGMLTCVPTATTNVITWNGTPVATFTYIITVFTWGI